MRQMRQFIPLLLLAAAAQSTAEEVPSTSALPPGVWKGNVETVNVEAGGTSYSGTLEMLLVSCRGEIQIFTTAEGETDQMPPVTAVQSLEGSHLFYYAAAAAKQPD
ncbi:MAG: hypothetical protein HY856_10680 [Burkholderiales bacterium]|nr:hypothetical protein [Burkholderiales bacterium]